MTMKPTDRILGPVRGDAATALAYARANGAARLPDVEAYITEVYRLAPLVGIDASVVVAQSSHETDVWRSQWFRERLNPAGIGITGDPAQNAASKTFVSGTEAAQAQVIHLLGYTLGGVVQWPEFVWMHTGSVMVETDPRFLALLQSGYAGKAKTIADLAGKWAVDPQYATGICRHGNAIFPDLDGDTPVATKPYILLVAGHRAHSDGGNPAEKDLTDDLGKLYTDAFRGAGYRSDWWQRDLDRDSDPDDTVGGLDTVSLGCARHLDTISGPKLLLDLHFNGAHSPVHAIVPDSRGLTTAYAGGSPADDAYGNNVLDRAWAARWAEQVAKAFGLSVFRGRASEPGVMLEGETGVGLQGFRLATMAASARHRGDTVRLVLEHAGTSDWGGGAERQARFQRCAAIAVATTNAVYNVEDTKPTPPKPSQYEKPDTSWMTGKDATVRFTIKGEPVDVQVFAVRRQYEAIASTWRYLRPESGGPKVGPKLDVRETFVGEYIATVGKTRWIVTPAGSWILASALTPRVSVKPA
jgi:hypothetical protein